MRKILEGLTGWAIVLGLVGSPLVIVKAANELWNNRTLDWSASTTYSDATGLNGHVEYTLYVDGSKDVKIYPGLGHRLFDSELLQDLDGDGKIDRIRVQGPEWKANRLSKLLVRDADYTLNQERFDEADRKLAELASKYGK